MFASYYALRKIYGNDEDAFNTALLNQLDCVFNATPPVSGLLLGAGLAMEDKGHLNGIHAENDLKVGLMGPISGIGDVFIWILPMTILGSIAGYMAQQGSPVGILLWLGGLGRPVLLAYAELRPGLQGGRFRGDQDGR